MNRSAPDRNERLHGRARAYADAPPFEAVIDQRPFTAPARADEPEAMRL
jgi:hypothetical protein